MHENKLRQLLQIRLTIIDNTTGKSNAKFKPIEINGGYVQQFDLSMHTYGFDGNLELLPVIFKDESLSELLIFLQDQPVKIDILIQQQNQYSQDYDQLILSGFLSIEDPITLSYYDFIVDMGKKDALIPQFTNQLKLSFCDPLAYWLKQCGARNAFQKKTYTDVINELLLPFTSKSLFALTVDDSLTLWKSKRRLIISAIDTEQDSLYNYLIFILITYQVTLRFDYAAMQQKPKKLQDKKPKEFSGVDWPKVATPTYHIVAIENKDKPASKFSCYDWFMLRSFSRNANKSQDEYQTTNTNAKLSGTYPTEKSKNPCMHTHPISYKVKQTAESAAKFLLKGYGYRRKQAQQVTCSFNDLPSFCTKAFPLETVELVIPYAVERNKMKPMPIFPSKKGRVFSVTISMTLGNIADYLTEGVSLDMLKGFQSVRHSVAYTANFYDSEIKYQDLPEHSLMQRVELEGIIVKQTDEKKQNTNGPQYPYLLAVEKESSTDEFCLDSMQTNTECYWVKIPEFKDMLIKVPVEANLWHAQMRLPLKNGTRVSLVCSPEDVKISGVLAWNLQKPIEKNRQTEAMFFGSSQEMSLTASSDSAGKEQALSLGVALGDKVSHSIEFDMKKQTTTIRGESG